MFRIKPHTHQRHSEGSNKPCVHQDPGTPQRLSQNCVWVSPVEVPASSGLLQGRGLRVQQTWVWHKPLRGGAARIYTGLGNRLLEGTNKTLCAPGPRRKEQWPHKRLTQTRPWLSRSLSRGMGMQWPAAGLGAPSAAVHDGTFWRRSPLSSLLPPKFGLRSNNREGTRPSPSIENWIKDWLNMALPIRTRSSFPISQSPP